ncbi:anthranilate synthase component I, partial [Acidianus sp. DSM 29099]|nr:anthranilate synthase component I [Acidianus sp. RZ1]
MTKVFPITSFPQPYEVFRCVKQEEKFSAMLESVAGPQNKARYSVIAWGHRDYINSGGGDIAEYLYGAIERSKGVDLPMFDAYVGYISYDAVRYWENIKDVVPQAEKWPNGEFFLPNNMIIYDHNGGKVYVNGEIPKGNCK